jgi:type I restriction enzyme S subunit
MVNGVGEPGSFENPAWPRYVRTTDIAGPTKLRDDTFASLPPETAARAPLERRDIVMTAAGAVGKSFRYELDEPACYAGYLVRFRPRADVDPRFVSYWMESTPYWDQIVMGKVVSTIENFSASKYQNMRILCPDFDTQRAIADYLDAETSRVDALIAAKRRMVSLLRERATVALSDCLAAAGFEFPDSLLPTWESVKLPPGWRIIRLSQVLRQLTNGYVGPTRDILLDDGIRYVQSLHIKNGLIEFERRPFYVSEEWHRARPRIHLRQGDVLIVQTGDIGQVAVVPPGFGEASCHALQIARVHEHIVSGEYLGAYLRTPFGYQSLLSRATGALHPHLEGGIRDIPIVSPPLAAQAEFVRATARVRQRCERLESTLGHQMALLGEHRQALITAAVTGEVDIPGAAA